MDCSLPGSSHGIFQARVLEGVAISFSIGSSPPRGRTQVSCIVGRHFTIWATRADLLVRALLFLSLPGGAVVKNPPANAGYRGGTSLIAGLGRSPGGENGNPFQYSYLENPLDRRTLWAIMYGVTQIWTQLSTHTFHSYYFRLYGMQQGPSPTHPNGYNIAWQSASTLSYQLSCYFSNTTTLMF